LLTALCLLLFCGCENPFIKDALGSEASKDGTYTVTFNPDGGALVGSATATVASGGTVASLPSATKADYDFGGWWTAQDGGGQAFTGSTAVTASITVQFPGNTVRQVDGGRPRRVHRHL
jgi:hypothetical protein